MMLLRLLTLVPALPGLFLGLLLALVSWRQPYVYAGVLWVPLSPRLARLWPYSTTLGYVILRHPSATREVEVHELIHVEQFQVVSLFVTLVVYWLTWIEAGWIALVLWLLAWPMFYTCAVVVATARGLHPYEDNVLERHAYVEARVQTEKES